MGILKEKSKIGAQKSPPQNKISEIKLITNEIQKIKPLVKEKIVEIKENSKNS